MSKTKSFTVNHILNNASQAQEIRDFVCELHNKGEEKIDFNKHSEQLLKILGTELFAKAHLADKIGYAVSFTYVD